MMDGEPGALRYPVEAPPEFGEVLEIAPGVLWSRLPLPMALDHVNVYALDEGSGWTLIDTGMDTAKSRAVWDQLLQGPLSGKPIERVIVTHHHPDHIGLAGWFQTEFGAELITTRTAWLLGRMMVLDEQPVPTSETLNFWRAAGMPEATLSERAAMRPFNFSDMVAPLPLGYTRLVDGDQIRIGGRQWTVLMGDGHAPEHATFWSQDDHLVLGGDQLLPSISPNLGVYATEPSANPVQDWITSCERFATMARPDQLVLPGHKLPYFGLPFRLEQLIVNHHGAFARLMDYLDQPRTAVDCFPVLFKRKIGEAEYGLALVEAVAHMNYLYQAGQIDRTLGADGTHVWVRKGEP